MKGLPSMTPQRPRPQKRTLQDVMTELGLPKEALTTKMEAPQKLTPKDKFALVVVLPLLPYILSLYLAIAIYLIPIRLLSLLYVKFGLLRGNTTYIPTTAGFYLFATMETVLVLPVLAIAFAHMILVQILTFVLFCPIGFVTGVSFKKNIAVIHGVGDGRGGSSFTWIMSPLRIFELWRCLYGMYHRQGFWEWVLAVPWMTMINPVLKYFFTTNIWLWDLEEKWCNQWTQKFPSDVSRKSVEHSFVQYISHAFLKDDQTRQEIDTACFCAHYAMPPPGCNTTCFGMQYAPRKLSTNLTLTKHWHLDSGARVPLSETGVDPVHEVNLYYFNAWHFLTGYVEVNLQSENGGNIIEHPMWIVMPKTGYLGNRLYAVANGLFGEFAPELHNSIVRSNS